MAKKAEQQPLDDEALAALLGSDADKPESDDYALSEEDLDTLSDAEREAYEEEAELMTGADDDDEAGDNEADPAPQETTTSEQDAAAQQQELDELRAAEVQRQQSQQIETLRASLAELDGEQRQLTNQLLEGDLGEDEYQEKLGELTQKRDRANSQIAVAEYEAGSAKRAADKAWETASTSFANEHPEFVSDEHFEGFNKVVGDISENPQTASLPFEKQLALAAQTYAIQQQALGKDLAFSAAPAPKAQAKPQQPAQQQAPDRSQKPAAPQTIAAIPSEQIDPHASQHAAIAARIERAGPEEAERIMASLDEATLDQVLAYG